MRNTGITLYRLDQDDHTPKTVDGVRLSADMNSAHGDSNLTGPHARVFNAQRPDGTPGERITAWWIGDKDGNVAELFTIDSRVFA